MVSPGLSGLTEVFITTDDVDPNLRLYRDYLGFEIIAEGRLPEEQVHGIWSLPSGVEISAMRLGVSGTESGFIHLLNVDGANLGPAIRPKVLEGGLFDFDVATRDVASVYRDLVALGYAWSCPPQLWTTPAFGLVDVEEGLCHAPDGVNLVFPRPFENKGSVAWERDPSRRFSEMYSSVYVANDLAAEIDFWGPEGLGLRVGADVALDHPGILKFLNVEEHAGLRMVLMTARGSGPGRVEIICPERRPATIDYTRRQRPGIWRGLSGWGIRLLSLDAALEAVRRTGGEVRTGPLTFESPLTGRVTAAGVTTPCGVFVELYQPEA